ncbi:3'-5' exonuclease [Chryseobacterium soli]|uniref:3'-5' exonuclease n=1 Tax=Chryseobacterium soli TaxID=445961 RepID=UPI0029529A22|nr:3'-5' exonuclease [Chryseobacterium soli]MDV7696272.1 3'-5' exonuclease [Chryseobacterium soli]
MGKILIIDIETTGFLQQNGKIVEIGIVELDLSNGNKKIIFDQVTHEKGITREEVDKSWIVKNSTLDVETIRTSKSLDALKPEIQSIIHSYNHGTTAYNNAFDFGFMEHRGFIFPKKLACPMKLSTGICKIPSVRGSGYKWPKVEEAYEYFFGKTDYIEAHRGADDALHEADIVYELYRRGVFKIETNN